MSAPNIFRRLALLLCLQFLFACGSGDSLKDQEEREFQQKLKEAQELAKKIQSGDLFNEEAVILEKKLHPSNVCNLTADFSSIDFGDKPDFRGDGVGVVYSDKTGTVYYYYFKDRRVYKLAQNGRNPSFGMLQETEGDQKFIFEYFKLRKNSWEGDSFGIMMNTEVNYLKDPQLISEIPAEEPYLVKNDQNIIYKHGGKYYQLDDKMKESEITEEEFVTLRDSRFSLNNDWVVRPSYRGISGVWITDATERNWCQLRGINNIQTLTIIPKDHDVYAWSPEAAGLCLIRPLDPIQFTIEIPNPAGVQKGDLFDVFGKRISPISNEVLGPDEEKFKGTLRVVNIVQDKLVCEYQTKLHLAGIFADDIAVAQKDSSLTGNIL